MMMYSSSRVLPQAVLAIWVGVTGMSMMPSPAPAAEIVEGPKVSWNLSSYGNPRAFTKGLDALSSIVDKRTGGNFTIKVHYGEALSKVRENLDGIKMGAFEAAIVCGAYHPNKTSTITVLELPFLPIKNADVMQRLEQALFNHPAVVKDAARWNAKFLYATLVPQNELMGKGKAPNTLSNFKGLRVRAVSGLGRAMKRLGAVPMSMPSPEIYQAMQSGALDAVGLGFSYAFISFKIPELSTWYTDNLKAGAGSCPTTVNLDAWNALPAQYQKLIEDSIPEIYETLKAGYRAADEKNIPMLKTSGLERIHYSEKQLTELRKLAAGPVWEQWVKDATAEGIPGRELLDFVLKTANELNKKY